MYAQRTGRSRRVSSTAHSIHSCVESHNSLLQKTPKNRPSLPSRRANYVHHLVDGTGTERDPRNTQPPAYNPRKNGGTFKTPICLGTSTWRQMADGRWTRQMAERVAEKQAPIRSSAANPRPRRSTAGSSERSVALRLCEEDDHAVMDQVTSCWQLLSGHLLPFDRTNQSEG